MSEYAFAMDENTYVFRLRAQRGDLKRCTLHYADRAAMTPELDFQCVEMPLWRSDKLYDWFEVTLKCPFERIAYHFELDDGTAFIVRPSGTEPKIKLYVNVNDRDEAKARELLSHLTEESRKLLK